MADEKPIGWGPPPLTTRPEGLLSSLGIQSGGKYPQHLGEDLLPTYDLGQWYREYNQQFAVATVAAGVGIVKGTFTDCNIVVPDGEMWVVNRLNCYVTAAFAAAAESEFALIRVNNVNATQIVLGQKRIHTTAGVSGFGFVDCDAALPIILRPTVKLQLGYTNSNTAQATSANYAFTTQVAYNRCLI